MVGTACASHAVHFALTVPDRKELDPTLRNLDGHAQLDSQATGRAPSSNLRRMSGGSLMPPPIPVHAQYDRQTRYTGQYDPLSHFICILIAGVG